MDYEAFKSDLNDFSKIYFPENSSDANKASSSQMMIEQTSFIGDILAFYLEDRFANTNNVTAKDTRSIINNAKMLGYKFNGPTSARGYENFYITVPAITGSSGQYIPDSRYALKLKNVRLQNTNGVPFEALEDVDFTKVNFTSSLHAKVFKSNSEGQPTRFVLKTTAEVMAGKTVTETIAIGDYVPWRKVQLSEKNVLDVLSVVDSDGEYWYEVDYAAQEAIFESIENLGDDKSHVPYVLKMKSVPRRFVRNIDPITGVTTLTFGPGKASEIGTAFIPDPSDIALDLKGKLTFSPAFIDPQNFLSTRTMGLSPYNTSLTIKVRAGGGKITNTAQNSLKDIVSKEIEYNSTGLDGALLNETISSLSAENLERIIGGREAETIEEIKQNSSAFFAAQNRLETKEDYIARCLSLPSKFGRIFRVYAVSAGSKFGVQLYVLAKNDLGQLIVPTSNLKKNLKSYLKMHTRLNQGIDIMDGSIINIALEYSLLVRPGFNKASVKVQTLSKLKEFFDVNKWQIGQPIILDEIRCLLVETEGVVSVTELNVINRNNSVNGKAYSAKSFDVKGNTRNGIIFPPNDSIFEIKFPNGQDLKVSAI